MSIHRSLTAAALAVSCTVGLTVAPPAAATAGDLTCTVSNAVATINPALLPGGTSTVTVNNPKLTGCRSTTGETMTMGTVKLNGVKAVASGVGANQCPPLVTFEGGVNIDWNNGNPASHATVTLNTNPLNGPVGLDAKVTSGSLEGDRITPAIAVTINLDCPTAGLTTITIPAGQVFFA